MPFRPELKPDSGSPREQLAAWVTDRRNPSFSQATVNRIWALLLGRPLAEPIDDLPSAGQLHPALDLLAADFAAHDYDLHRLIRIDRGKRGLPARERDRCAEPGRSRSGLGGIPDDQAAAGADCRGALPGCVGHHAGAAVALVRPAVDLHWAAMISSSRYGDSGEDEFDAKSGTIPQRLLLMNGKVAKEKTAGGLLTAAGQIAGSGA